MIPPLDQWDVDEDDRDPRGCALTIGIALVLWAVIVALVKAWPWSG
jgi:hypothetical protein